MRLLWTVLLLVGCGFQPLATSDVHIDAPPGAQVDAPKIYEDAPPAKVYMDAPPACADDDGDGVCNTVDDWPCGAKPDAIATSIMLSDNGGATRFKLSAIALDGQGTLVVANHGTNLRIQMNYSATDSACADCQDQLEVGWHPTGARLGCILDRDVLNDGDAHAGTINDTQFTAPDAHGAYELRVHIGQKVHCDDGGNVWYGGSEPGVDGVIAKLCVP